jgi:hypothetical protein
MSTVNAPFGLRPVMINGGQPYTGAGRWIQANVDTGAIAKGSLVSLSSAGDIVACTAAGTTTRDVNSPIGVVLGVSFVDPTLKQPQWDQYLPANAVTAGYTNIMVQIEDDPDALYEIQFGSAITRANIGENCIPTTFTVNTTSKLSNTVGGTLSVTTAMFRIVDIATDMQNAPGDAFTRIYVKFNPGYHAYTMAVGL